MTIARLLLLPALLAACAGSRGADGPGASPPALVPIGPVLAAGDGLAAAAAVEAPPAAALSAAAGALADRAAALAPAAGADSARLAALAARAEGLRAPVLSPEERARLASLQ